MNRAKQLYELQQFDLEIEQKTETLSQIMSKLGQDDELVSARSALNEAGSKLGGLEHTQRTEEWCINELHSKIAQVEKKLYEGSVKNPRELISFKQEVDIIKGQRGEREDQLLAIMMQVDAAQKDVALKKSELETIERDWRYNQDQLSKQRAEIESALAALQEQRKLQAGQIDAASLRAYEELRQLRPRLAVAMIVQGGCQGCRISLPMSVQRSARIGHALVTCSNCGRILFLD